MKTKIAKDIEKPTDDDEIGFLVDKFNDQPLGSLTVTNISKFFDKACEIYHAKKTKEEKRLAKIEVLEEIIYIAEKNSSYRIIDKVDEMLSELKAGK